MRKYLTTFLGGFLLVGGAATVHANLVVTVSEVGFGSAVIISQPGSPSPGSPVQGVNFPSATLGDFTINIESATAGVSAAPSFSELLSATTDITNNNTSGPKTLTLTISETGYSMPSAPPTLQFLSNIGGTIITGDPSNTLSFQGYVDPTNTPTTVGAFTPGPQSTPITAPGSYNTSATTLIGTLSPPYAILGTITYTLGASRSVNYSSSETLMSVPEPASLAVLSLAGVGLLARRRRA